MPPTRVLIDTDPGLDDTAAILFALACPDLVTVEMLSTVYGNSPVEHTTRNALIVLEAARRTDIPVYQGAAMPFTREPRYSTRIHSDDGLGGLAHKYPPSIKSAPGIAAEQIVERVMAEPGELTLVALGPLTNLALAIRMEPRIAENVQRIVLMGGAARVPGNITPVASANLVSDPEAASIVYTSGAQIVQAGLDVARPTVITPPHLERIAAAPSPSAKLISECAVANQASYLATYGDSGGARFNDVPTLAYMLDPTLFKSERFRVEIETTGTYTSGMTVVDWRGQYGRPPQTDVLTEVDVPRLVEMFTSRLCALPA